ncbi:hypothetical protein BC939DRAFT_498731 [Gamsiella multidivaricata]|uniref:uncharacterized protein n=1 Tax=Gamsiella multidivaricata TaxID=101098 RepID=UPI00221E9339|nr:uncharacterized protein BC939DRAFT_498731 [Gamsiella multidivaricata]KAI7831762.1 hypothetical protein BC939DRAFT_498731 [Gamsiella multidivaricata]
MVWRVSIPILDDDELPIVLSTLKENEKKLGPATHLSKVFTEEPSKEAIHIIVQRPSPDLVMTSLDIVGPVDLIGKNQGNSNSNCVGTAVSAGSSSFSSSPSSVMSDDVNPSGVVSMTFNSYSRTTYDDDECNEYDDNAAWQHYPSPELSDSNDCGNQFLNRPVAEDSYIFPASPSLSGQSTPFLDEVGKYDGHPGFQECNLSKCADCLRIKSMTQYVTCSLAPEHHQDQGETEMLAHTSGLVPSLSVFDADVDSPIEIHGHLFSSLRNHLDDLEGDMTFLYCNRYSIRDEDEDAPYVPMEWDEEEEESLDGMEEGPMDGVAEDEYYSMDS